MSAVVLQSPSFTDKRYWAECIHCDWARPACGVVRSEVAERYAAEHNAETHPESVIEAELDIATEITRGDS